MSAHAAERDPRLHRTDHRQIYGVVPDRQDRGVLERIQNSGKHLLALINDVLDLAKIEAGQLTLSLDDYSWRKSMQSVVTAASIAHRVPRNSH